MFLDFNINGASKDIVLILPKDLISVADFTLRVKYDAVNRIVEAIKNEELQLAYCPRRSRECTDYLETYGVLVFNNYKLVYYLNFDNFFFLKKEIVELENKYPYFCQELPHMRTPKEYIATEENIVNSLKKFIKKQSIPREGTVMSIPIINLTTAFISLLITLSTKKRAFLNIITNKYPYKTDHVAGYSSTILKEDYLPSEDLQYVPIYENQETTEDIASKIILKEHQTPSPFDPVAYVNDNPCTTYEEQTEQARYLKSMKVPLAEIAILLDPRNEEEENYQKYFYKKLRDEELSYDEEGEKPLFINKLKARGTELIKGQGKRKIPTQRTKNNGLKS